MIKQRGASLLEVLIAVVIISIGLLGLAGLQTSSIKSNHSSYLRSQATILAYDLSDRMRASRDATLNGRYADGSTHADKVAWNNLLTQIIGNNVASSVAQNGNQFTITITWDDARGDIQNPTNPVLGRLQTFTYVLEL